MMNFHKGAALFVGGVLFGSAGFKLLSSKDAKKAYTMTAAHCVAGVRDGNGLPFRRKYCPLSPGFR